MAQRTVKPDLLTLNHNLQQALPDFYVLSSILLCALHVQQWWLFVRGKSVVSNMLCKQVLPCMWGGDEDPCDCLIVVSQWGTADAEIKVPSGENTELKRSTL